MKKTVTAQMIADVLTVRNDEVNSKDTETAISNALRSAKAIDSVLSQKHFHATAAQLLLDIAIADKNVDKKRFVSVKCLVKIVACLNALGKGMKSELDPYTRTIGENIVMCNKLSNKDALVSLSRSIEYDETEVAAHLVARYKCSANTAGTQTSSTRMMLRALDMCEVNKGKRGDIITFKDNDRARALIGLFQVSE